MMLISKTPYRISFFGGGSDLPAFLEQEQGATLSSTINLFVYVIINKTKRPIRFIHEDVQVGLVNMRNDIVKEALETFGIETGLDIVSMADVHAVGAGLGGSSAFAVGLVNGLINTLSGRASPGYLAQKSCQIEIDKCGFPIGYQDQYAAAFGGFNLLEFYGKNVKRKIILDPKNNLHQSQLMILQRRLILLYTGVSRNENSGTMLQRQQSVIQENKEKFQLIQRTRDRAYQALDFLNISKLDKFGELLHENWMDKRTLVSDLSSEYVDTIYDFALKNGAIGGKLMGAGGGGFMLFYVPHNEIYQSLVKALKEEFPTSIHYPFEFYHEGSTINRV